MHLFLAREALDFHLGKIKYFMNPKISIFRKALAAVTVPFGYMVWYLGLWLPSFGVRPNQPKPLDSYMRFVQAAAKRLARDLFHRMAFYQQKLVQKQNTLNRYVDIGADLFAVSCVSSYAASLHGKGEAKEVLELADLFCHQARVRISRNFKDASRNDDALSYFVAKRLLAGDYEWLENDIVKS
ncbi:MAG: hypothetical protein HZA72_01645 [Candidatus Omnitrophica bacterium]|nr:hypothetical protein [Candidatus Omnitrophota bacterium]